jgi:uncharacterized protein
MDARHVPAIFYAIGQIIELHSTPVNLLRKHIVLYGGEPLAKRNFDVVNRLVSAGNALGFHFSAITNGHDLNDYLGLLGTNGIRDLQISIDGPKKIHDKRRVSLDGTSSFEKIVANIFQVLDASDAIINLRVHVDAGGQALACHMIPPIQSE